MLIKDLKNKKIRFFLMQSNDTGLFLFKEFYFGYLLNLMIDKLGFKLNNIEAEIVFPFKKYVKNLFHTISSFEEEVFIIYLENSYHSNNYGYSFVIKLLDVLKSNSYQPEIIIYSLKISYEESKYILENYDFVKIIIRTDIEYIFYEYFINNKSIENISNLVLNTSKGIIETNKEKLTYDLGKYIIGGHYSGYVNKFKLSKDYIISLLDEDDEKTDELITYRRPKEKRIADFRYRPDTAAMISTGRGCKYNCSYCYRGVKYSEVRQIPLDIIKKDLDYLKEMYYEDIYLYDDCFLTSNISRLDKVLDLLANYDFYYGISIRYEICSAKVFEMLKKIKLYRVQIGLQSISLETNIETGRGIDLEKFKKLVLEFKNRGVEVSIDIILGLPGETLKDFIKTVNFAVSLNPGSIHINTLFLNPGTKIVNEKEKYGIETNENSKWLFSVPTLVSSTTFPKEDIEKAKKYVEIISKKYSKNRIILR